MDHTRKKIALLIGTLIISQAIFTQNMHGMDVFDYGTTEENATLIYDFWSNTFASLCNPAVTSCQNTLHTGKNVCANLYNNASTKGSALYNQISNQTTEAYNAAKQHISDETPLLCEYFAHIPLAAKASYNNVLVVSNQAANQIKNGTHSLYNNLPSRSDCKNFWTRALPTIKNDALGYYEQAPAIKPLIIKGLAAYGLYNYVLPGYISYPIIAAGTALAAVKVAPMLPYATQANTQLQAIGVDTQAIQDTANNTIEFIEFADNNITVENIKNIPTILLQTPSRIDNAIKGRIKNYTADLFNIDPNGPINADVIIDKLVKKTAYSVALYTTVMGTTLFAAYKAGMYCVNKYQEYKNAHALDESIKQNLTDEKIAEIAQLTGKELSPNDLQEIINTIKVQATTAEDGRVTQEIIDHVVKEYVAKQVNA